MGIGITPPRHRSSQLHLPLAPRIYEALQVMGIEKNHPNSMGVSGSRKRWAWEVYNPPRFGKDYIVVFVSGIYIYIANCVDYILPIPPFTGT